MTNYISTLKAHRLYGKAQWFYCVLAVLLWASVVNAFAEGKLQITGVSTDRTTWQAGEKPVRVSFNINQPSTVALKIYDARNYLIRAISSTKALQAGDHTLLWDGRDARGKTVPPEAYVYTLEASTTAGVTVTHDLSDQTGGQTLIAEDVKFDTKKEVLRYKLPYSARMFVRAGIKEGSILRTIANGTIRQAGMAEEPWDGWDESRVVNLKNHPKLDIYAEGFRLSRNTIIVTSSKKNTPNPEWLDFSKKEIVKRKVSNRPKGLNFHAYHHREACRDAIIKLSLPGNVTRTKEGVPVISGPTEFRIDLAPQDAMMFESQRFEVVFFMNAQMIYENEVSYTPYTWTWNPKVITPGINYMTAFIVGFGGHYAVSTVKFRMAKAPG